MEGDIAASYLIYKIGVGKLPMHVVDPQAPRFSTTLALLLLHAFHKTDLQSMSKVHNSCLDQLLPTLVDRTWLMMMQADTGCDSVGRL